MDLQDYVGSGLKIVESYEKRSKIIVELIKEAARLVEEYSAEQDEMLLNLRETLARTESLRKKDFDRHIECVLWRREELKSALRESLKILWAEEGEMVKRLRDIFSGGRPEDLEFIKKVMTSRVRESEEAVARNLMELHMDQAELTAKLKALLSKGLSVRTRDFKEAVRELDIMQQGRKNGSIKTIEEFEKLRLDVLGQWINICSVYENVKQFGLKGLEAKS